MIAIGANPTIAASKEMNDKAKTSINEIDIMTSLTSNS